MEIKIFLKASAPKINEAFDYPDDFLDIRFFKEIAKNLFETSVRIPENSKLKEFELYTIAQAKRLAKGA